MTAKKERQEGKIRKRKKEKLRTAQAVLYICYFCLVCGIILLLGDMGKFSYYKPGVFGSLLLISGGLWLCCANRRIYFEPANRRVRASGIRKKDWLGQTKRKMGSKAFFLCLLIYFGYFFLQREKVSEQFQVLLLCLAKMEKSTKDFTLLFSAFALLLSPVCFFLIFILNMGWLFYGITLPLLFLGPMFGYYPPWFGLFLLMVFHIGDGIYHGVYWIGNDEPEESDTKAVVLQKGVLAGILVVLTAFFLALLVPAENRKAWMKDSVRFVQIRTQSWRNIIDNMDNSSNTGSAIFEGFSGKINRGNHYASGSVKMEVTLSEKPKERIYLKNFTGGLYKGDEWLEADESDFYQLYHKRQGEYASSYLSPAYFQQRQFELIQYGKMEDWRKERSNFSLSSADDREYRDWSKIQQMRIRPVNGIQRAFFAPYLSFYTSRDSGGGYNFSLFSWEEYKQYQQKLKEKPLQWFEQMEEPYREYVKQSYLDVPKERLPRFLALCNEHPLEDPEEITAFIRQTLTEYAVYSQTPGFMPYGTDIAEYFLFDGQKGYCQHFATAAVLLYRIYGIPARYAAGYMADPGDFFLEQDRQYCARLTDEKAHAWAEIYLDGPGWIPIEVTPPSEIADSGGVGNGGAAWFSERKGAENSVDQTQEREKNNKDGDLRTEEENENFLEEYGKLSEDYRETLEKERNLQVEEDENYPESSTGNTENLPEERGKENHFRVWEAARKAICAAGAVAAILLLLAGARWAGGKWKQKKLEKLGADEVYQRIVELLHLGGYLMDFDGTEADFPEAVMDAWEKIKQVETRSGQRASQDNGLSLDKMQRIKDYAFQTAYGREISTDEQKKRVQEGYWQIEEALRKHAKGIKRLKIAVWR